MRALTLSQSPHGSLFSFLSGDLVSRRDGPFHPLRIHAVKCDMETARQHLVAFIRAFISYDARARAEHIVFRLAPKNPNRIADLHKLLDERFTSPPKDLAIPTKLPTTGVYFEGGDEAWLLSLEDAMCVSNYLTRDAIWSGVAGNYAVFLHHEGLKWYCYRSLPSGERKKEKG